MQDTTITTPDAVFPERFDDAKNILAPKKKINTSENAG
jgi:hypothetical protein